VDKVLNKVTDIKIATKKDDDNENIQNNKINDKKEIELKDEILDILTPSNSVMVPEISNINLLKANT